MNDVRLYIRKRSVVMFQPVVHSLTTAKIRLTETAPDFCGQAVVNGRFKEIKLSDYKGKYLVLFFYPLDL